MELLLHMVFIQRIPYLIDYMRAMTQTQIEEFLSKPRHAVLGTNRVGESPQLSSVWYAYETGRLYISAGAGTVKVRNLRRDPRVSVCVDGCYPDYRTVIVYGTAELHPQDALLTKEMHRRIIRRYHDTEEKARRYEESIQGEPTVLIVVMPQKIIGQDFN